MPSFLSKVFGKKKDGSPALSPRASTSGSLLDGKYEAVSPTISPSASRFEAGTSNGPRVGQRAPHLSLHFPDRQRAGAEGVFVDEVERDVMLSDDVIGARRLGVDELLPLVQACVKHISEKGTRPSVLVCLWHPLTSLLLGLETLGLMHPHWYSASPSLQRKLISLYLAPAAPTASPALSSFQDELVYSDPRDAAAVLRWAVRHFAPAEGAFGGAAGYGWYDAFARAERESGYPAGAFESKLTLPAKHVLLLAALLDLTASLAAHAEANGVSGSKFAKLVGLWLLRDTRAPPPPDWRTLYGEWDRAGRMLEHLFLARIRAQAATLPKRLTTLANGYPYGAPDGVLLARPRTSTRLYAALLVSVDSPLAGAAPAPRRHPLRIAADALAAAPAPAQGEASDAWERVRAGAREDGGEPSARRAFADETLNLLSLVPLTSESAPSTTALTVTVVSPVAAAAPAVERVRSGASTDAPRSDAALRPKPSVDALLHPTQGPASVTSALTFTDWTEFQALGFAESGSVPALAATLREADPDVEVTHPSSSTGVLARTLSRKGSAKRPTSPGAKRAPRLSVDIPAGGAPSAATSSAPTPTPAPVDEPRPRTTQVVPVQLDEAFVDAWADAITDPSAGVPGPQFVVARLRAPAPDGPSWVVLERTFSRPTPVATPRPVAAAASPAPVSRRSSERPGSTASANASASGKRRFGLFGRSISEKGEKGKGRERERTRSPVVGEMGEVLAEEPEEPKATKGLAGAVAAVTSAAGAAVAAVVGTGKTDAAQVRTSTC
jgi:hypothetical protein